MPRKTLLERGPVAAWLIESRRARGWTAEHFLEEMAKATGYAPTRPNYARWESGAAHPSDESMARLTAFWKAEPNEEPVSAEDPVVAAMDRQTAAIAALVGELRLWRTEDRERIAQLEAWMDQRLEQTPGAPGTAGAAARRAPRKTAG